MPGYPYSTVPGAQGTGAPPFPQPGMTAPAGGGPVPPNPNDAQRMIQNLLTQPRANVPGQGTNAPQGQQIGGGIAGVATTADAEGIKVYNDKTNYKEWEFIYDYTKDRGPASTPSGPGGTPASQLGTPPGQQPNQPGQPSTGFPGQPTSPFGTQPGMTQPPGMGAPIQQQPMR
jgi:hypothetical protein